MRGRATSVVLPAVAVLTLVTVVAVAATGSTPHGSDRSRAPSDVLLDALFTLWLVALAAGGVLLVYGLTQRKAIAQELASGRYRRFSLLASLALVVLAVAAVRLVRLLHSSSTGGAGEEAPPGGGDIAATSPGQRGTPTYEPGISWFVVVAVVGLVVAAAVAYVMSRRRVHVAARPDDLAEQLALALDDALDDLRAEADPRRAIVAAYARMERVLAASGVARHASETADEYLGRLLRVIAPDSEAVARLTGLFTQAKFSHHDIDATMKEDAIDALEQVRDELRPAPDGPPASASASTVAEAGS
jgi:hypothetical protein